MKLYLTFDCGYEAGYTNSILDTLKENDIKATFFITGHYLKTSTDIVKRMIEEGHMVANHTMNHKSFEKGTNSALNDILALEELYFKTFNMSMVKYVRPPKGEYKENVLEALNEKGYKTILWSLAYKDWEKDKSYELDYSYNAVLNRIHNGAIILMHTVSSANERDLDKILKTLKKEYLFKGLNEL